MKKRNIIIAIISVIIFVSVIIVAFNILGKKEVKKAEQKIEDKQYPKEVREKPQKAVVEDAIRNFSSIYISLVNDKELDFSFLDNVLKKDTAFYSDVVKEINSYRDQNIKLASNSIDIEDIKEAEDGGFKVAVKEIQQKTLSNGKSEELNKSGEYSVEFKDGRVFILNFKQQ